MQLNDPYGPSSYYSSLLNFGATPINPYDPAAIAVAGVSDTTPFQNIGGPSGGGASSWADWSNAFKDIFGTKESPGWGGLALSGAQGLVNAYTGMQQLGIAQDTLKENKRQFDLNYGAQRSTTNTALEDRQRARIASNPGAYQSVGDYMKLHGI